VTDEQRRLAHAAAEQSAREALVPAARPCPRVPGHEAELMAAHEGQPSMAVQAATHGTGIPAADHGVTDQAKYS
jgi:hypothetical protein